MPRKASMTIGEAVEACRQNVGERGDFSAKITSSNRQWVRAWLVAHGLPSSYVSTLSLDSLAGAYHDTSDTTLGGMKVMARNAPRDEEDNEPEENNDTPAEPVQLDIEDSLPMPTPTPKQKRMTPDADTAAKKLGEALAMIAGAGGLDEDRVIQLINEHAPKSEALTYRVEIKMPDRPKIEQDNEPRHEAFPEVLSAVGAGLNVLLVGPAGCGKTHMAEQVAKTLGIGFRFSGAVASEYKLLGFIDAHGKTVTTEYRRSYEEGGLFLWDEMDASAPGALLAFNAGLANGHQDFPDSVIKRHADFRAVASANTYGNGADRMYVGRNQLDAASLDRFYMIPMDYDEKLERTLYGDDEWTSYVHKARKAVATLKLRHVVSMRAIDQGQRMLAAGQKWETIARAVLWKHLDKADIAKVTAAMGGPR